MVATHAGARGTERSGGLPLSLSKVDHSRNLGVFGVTGVVAMAGAFASAAINGVHGMVGSESANYNGWYPLNNGLNPNAMTEVGLADGLVIGGSILGALSVMRAIKPTTGLASGLLLAAGVAELAIAGNLAMHHQDASSMFSSSSVNPEHVWTIGPINGATIDSVTTAAHNTGMEVALGLSGAATLAAVPFASRRK